MAQTNDGTHDLSQATPATQSLIDITQVCTHQTIRCDDDGVYRCISSDCRRTVKVIAEPRPIKTFHNVKVSST